MSKAIEVLSKEKNNLKKIVSETNRNCGSSTCRTDRNDIISQLNQRNPVSPVAENCLYCRDESRFENKILESGNGNESSCNNSDSTIAAGDSGDSRSWDFVEAGKSSVCLVSLKSPSVELEVTNGAIHSIGVKRAGNEARCQTKYKSKSCDNLHPEKLEVHSNGTFEASKSKQQCDSCSEISKRNKKNRFFSLPKQDDACNHDSSDSKKKRKFIIILKGVLKCNKKKKLTKPKVPYFDKCNKISNGYESSPGISSSISHEEKTSNFSSESHRINLTNESKKEIENRFSESLSTAQSHSIPFVKCEVKTDKVLSNKEDIYCTKNKSLIVEREPTTQDFLTQFYHESLLQRFGDLPNNRCFATVESLSTITCGPQPPTPEAPAVITESFEAVNYSFEPETLNLCEELYEKRQFESETCSEEVLLPSAVLSLSPSTCSSCSLLSSISDKSSPSVTNLHKINDDPSDHIHYTDNDSDQLNGNDIATCNSEYTTEEDLVECQKIISHYLDNEIVVNKETVFLQPEEAAIDYNSERYGDTSSDNSVIDSDISDCETSDSSVDYDVTPIDDKYFDLHYDPYYYHGSYSLDDIPADQPIDYPSPYLVPSGAGDVNNDNWWQRFDGKPGRELYRSQSQPQDLGCEDSQPLDGNVPLHIFLSASQPLVNKLGSQPRSNSLENLNSRRRKEFGSFYSSFGSQLYTIKEELETEDLLEDIFPTRFSSCMNFGEEHFIDYEYTREYFNSCDNFRIPKYTEEPNNCLSSSHESFTDSFSIQESDILSYPDYEFWSETEQYEIGYYDRDSLTSHSSNSIVTCFNRNSSTPEEKYPVHSNESKEENILNPSGTMNNDCEDSFHNYENGPISKRLSRSFPNLSIEGGSSSLPDIPGAADYVPTPLKRLHVPKVAPTYENIPSNSKLLGSQFESKTLHTSSCFNGFSEKHSDDSNDSDYESNFNSDKYCMINREIDSNCLSSSDEFLPQRKAEGLTTSVNSSGIFSLNLNSDFSYEDATPSCLTSGVPSFSAYSSDTSLDFDTFSKSSKVFKWNGSSSISDLTSLSKEFSVEKVSLPSRGSCSATDLISISSVSENLPIECNLATTSYMQWSATVGDDLDENGDEFSMPLNLRSTSSSFVFTPHAQSKRNSLNTANFYSRTSTDIFQESDEEYESCEEVTSSSGSDSAEEDGMIRSYHLGLLGPPLSHGMAMAGLGGGMSEIGLVLETIAEDVEEDSGGESSSGHWLFSADNTDTDSVIHIPPPIGLHSSLPTQYETELDHHHSSSSVDTLVASEDEIVKIDPKLINCGKVKQMSADNAYVEYDSNENKDDCNHFGGSDRILQPTNHSFDTTNIRFPKNEQLDLQENANSRSVEYGSDEEDVSYCSNGPNPMDDIFDFSSLDTCEEISMTLNKKERDSSIAEVPISDVAVFNTSATSEPFADNSKKVELSDDLRSPDAVTTNENLESETTNCLDMFGLSNDWNSGRESQIDKNNLIVPIHNSDHLIEDSIIINTGTDYINDASLQITLSPSFQDEEILKNYLLEQENSPTISSTEEVNGIYEGIKTSTYLNNIKQKRPQRLKPRIRNKIRKSASLSDEDTDDTDGDIEEDEKLLQERKANSFATRLEEAGLEECCEPSNGSMDASIIIGTSLKSPDMNEGLSHPSAVFRRASISCVEENSDEDFILHDNSSSPPSDKEINHVEQTRKLVRPFSLGDLRYYYSSDSEPEPEEMKRRGFLDMKQCNIPESDISGYANSYQTTRSSNAQKFYGHERVSDCMSSPSSKPLNKPRRHQSMYNPVWNEKLGTWEQVPRGPKMHVVDKCNRSSSRPKPLSLDMAEEFMSQEGINNTDTLSVHNYNNPYAPSEPIAKYAHQITSNSSDFALNNNYCEENNSEEGPQRITDYSSTPDLTHKNWLSARNQPFHNTLPVNSPQYSRQPQFSSDRHANKVQVECDAGDQIVTDLNNCSVHFGDINSEDKKHLYSISSTMRPHQENSDSFLDSTTQDMNGRARNRVHTKTYGTHGEVEVYLEQTELQGQSTPRILNGDPKQGSRGVTFSPSVKEVNWRESYLDDTDFAFTQLEEKQVKRVKVISTDSPVLTKFTSPHVTSFKSPSPTRDNRINELNLSTGNSNVLNPFNNNRSVQAFTSVNRSTNFNCDINTKMDNKSDDSSATTERFSSSDNIPSSTPIWQRLKLGKIGSPKGPRPKIPPKPPSLSPRSSDSEGPKVSSSSSPESELSSPELKFKKIPSSPRFFSWGSKKEKKSKSPRSPPNKVEKCSVPSVRESEVILKSDQNPMLKTMLYETENAVDKRVIGDNENDFLKTRNSILNQIKTAIPNLNKVTNGQTLPSLSLSSDSDSLLDDTSLPTPPMAKPPLPPTVPNRVNSQILGKSRFTHTRRQYLHQVKNDPSAEIKLSGRASADEVILPQPCLNVPVPLTDSAYRNRGKSASERLKERFERFSKSTRSERERLARSTPDLSQMEESMRRYCRPRIDSSRIVSPHSSSDDDAAGLSSDARALPLTREEVRSTSERSSVRVSDRNRSNFSRVSAEFERVSRRCRNRSVGLLETDLDTGTLKEVLTPQETNLDDLYTDLQHLLNNLSKGNNLSQGGPTSSAPIERTRAKSLLHLDAASESPEIMENNLTATRSDDSRAKSMEFLLDDENRAAVQAPENELMKEGERKVSEAELRVRRSLQRLDVPDWMKTATAPQQGFLLRRRDYTSGAHTGGWSGFSSKTGSMSSLSSSRANTPPTKVVIPTRASTRSYGGLTSPSSQASISPSPSDRGSLFTYPLSRWSTSRLNSGMTTPTGSLTSQRSISYSRQPYLGWRSNTSLASLGGGNQSSSLYGSNTYLSPAERLALTVLPTQRPSSTTETPQNPVEEPCRHQPLSEDLHGARSRLSADVHSSIKEVTSAIVHYCNKETSSPHQSPRASQNPSPRAPSPRRLVWVESSFVGAKPISSPQTPTSVATPINGHQDDSRAPQPTVSEVFVNLINSFSSAGSSYVGTRSSPATSTNESTAASTNDSTTVLPDRSRVDSSNSLDDRQINNEKLKNSSFSDMINLSETSSRHSTADTNIRGMDSLNSRNSGSMSRDSSISRHSSCGRGELPASAGSFDDMTEENGDGLHVPMQSSSNFLSLTDDSTLTASCHSSFGNIQIEDDGKPKEVQMLDRSVKLDKTVEPIDEIKKSINSRRFSEGASPWEPSTTLPYENKPKIPENTWNMEPDDIGYGFNFSSHTTNLPLTEETRTEEIDKTESTTLEDVLDSLLALPSASRSPSPSAGPHPLSLVRPYTPHNFLPDSKIESSKADDYQSTESSFSSFFKNPDFGGPDPKSESHHKSICSSTSTFAPSSSSKDQRETVAQSSRISSGIVKAEEKTSVTFYLGRDEDDFASTGAMTDSHESRGFHSDLIDNRKSSTFMPNVQQSSFKESQQSTNALSSFTDPTEDYSCFFTKSPEDISNLTNQLGGDSYRTSETMDRQASVETKTWEEKKETIASSVTSARSKETKVTFHLPHMNIPQDSSSDNGSENLRFDIDDDDDDDAPSTSDSVSMMVQCRSNLCSNSGTVEEAKETYKTCHNCSVFYCSRYCRRIHWDKHKKMCEKIRASTAASQIVDKLKTDSKLLESLSAVARRGILSTGRGAVKIFFSDTTSAEKFLNEAKLPAAHYQPVQNIMPQEMGSEIYKKLIEQCRSYNTEIKFILYVSICTFSEAPTVSSAKCRRETIAKCAKLRLADPIAQSSPVNITPKISTKTEHHVITRDLNEPETLVLTTLPDSHYGLPARQAREMAFSNIVRELHERGVNLRLQYPDVYRKLSRYVDIGGAFPPLTLYPKDVRRGCSFMCIIMPEPDPSRLQRLSSDSSKVRTIDISRPHPAVT